MILQHALGVSSKATQQNTQDAFILNVYAYFSAVSSLTI